MKTRKAFGRCGRMIGGLVIASITIMAMTVAAIIGVAVLVWRQLARHTAALASSIGRNGDKLASHVPNPR